MDECSLQHESTEVYEAIVKCTGEFDSSTYTSEETETMRPMSFLAISAIAAVVTFGSPARADDNFDLNIAKGQITVTAHSGWHVNQDYGWAVKKGADKIKTKADFNLTQTTATVSGVPKGTYTLKGAVCSESNCAPFSKEITVN